MKAKKEPPRTVLAPFPSRRTYQPADEASAASAAVSSLAATTLSSATAPGTAVGAQSAADQGEVVLPTACLDRTPFNSRAVRTPERIHQLMEEMRADGQRQAITVAPRHDDPARYLVIDGETRFESALLGGINSLLAKIDTKLDTSSPLAIYTASKKLNGHIELSDIDQGIKWASLVNDGHTTVEQLAAVEGVSVETLHLKMIYVKLPPQVLLEVKKAPASFPYSIAYEIYRVAQETDDQTAAELAGRVVDSRMSRREIKGERERLANARKRSESGSQSRLRRRRERHSFIGLENGRGEYSVFNLPGAVGKTVVLKLDGLSDPELKVVEDMISALRKDSETG